MGRCVRCSSSTARVRRTASFRPCSVAPSSFNCRCSVRAESLAALLHVSPRTLHRQLKEEGATLQGLKDEVRRTRAVELLHRTQRPIKQVAEAAGFVNEKSFIRAFRGWTGQSPAEFRRVVRV